MKRRRALVASVLLAGGLALSGCADAELPTPQPRPTSEQVPVMSAAQVDAVLDRVVTGVALADTSHDAQILGEVADGPALSTRSARYQMVTKDPSLPAPAAIGGEQLQVVVPAAQDWPRSILVVTRRDAQDTLPQLLVLTQPTPRAQYKLTANVAMLGGATLPLTEPVRVGVPVRRAGQSDGLAIAPRPALDLYAAILNQSNPQGAEAIAGSPLTQALIQAQDAVRNNLTVACQGCFTVAFDDRATGTMWSFDTSDGGTLVIGEVVQNAKLVSQQGFQQQLTPEAVALSGVASITKEATLTRTILVGLHIPAKSADQPVNVVAGQDWLTSVNAS